MWAAYALIEWWWADVLSPGTLLPLLTIRAVVLLFGLGLLALLWNGRPPTPRGLRWIERYATLGFSIAVSIMAVFLRGWQGPYFAGILVVMTARGEAVADPWRVGLVSQLGHPLAFFGVMGVASLLSPALRAQLLDASTWPTVVVAAVSYACLTALSTWSGHTLWSARREALGSGWQAQYRVEDVIGEGGMGTVWTAYHTGLRRKVALKVVRADALDAEHSHRRFEREVDAVLRLTSPHTVRIFDYGIDEHMRCFYSMELLEGETLAQLVAREGSLTPARALHVATQLARSLAEAHAKAVVHRDIKPANVFITHSGAEGDFVKLLDFGLARFDEEDATRLTHAGVMLGTPEYMAPEMANGGRGDARADVYSAGATLYFMLAGAPPFSSDSRFGLILAHGLTPPSALAPRCRWPLPADLEAVVMRCLAKAPQDRFAHGAALLEALARCELAGTHRPPRWRDGVAG